MRRIWLSVLAVAVVAFGACGRSNDTALDVTSGAKAQRALLAASERTADANSSRVSMDIEMKGMPGLPPEGMSLKGVGAFNYENRDGEFTMTFPPTGGVELGEIKMILADNVVYEQFPAALAQQLGGKRWVKIDLATIGAQSGIDVGSLAQAQTNPTQALDYLKGASGDVTVVGREKLRGDDVTHLTAMLDLAKAAESATPAQKKAAEQTAQMFEGQLVPTNVWLDDEGRLRKMTYVIDMSKVKLPQTATSTPVGGTMNFAIEIWDFGVKVDAEPPPADEVTDLGAQMPPR